MVPWFPPPPKGGFLSLWREVSVSVKTLRLSIYEEEPLTIIGVFDHGLHADQPVSLLIFRGWTHRADVIPVVKEPHQAGWVAGRLEPAGH